MDIVFGLYAADYNGIRLTTEWIFFTESLICFFGSVVSAVGYEDGFFYIVCNAFVIADNYI